MPNGSPGNGFEGGGGFTPPPSYGGGGGRLRSTKKTTPVFQKTKSIRNNTASDEIYSLSSTISASAPSGALPSRIVVQNTGGVPISILAGFETYSTETAESDELRYLHVVLMPGQIWEPPVRAVIHTSAAGGAFAGSETEQFNGTAVPNFAPSSVNSGLLWKDIADLGGDVNATTDPITVTTASNHTNFFRVGDLIQIGRGTSQTDLTEANHYREILRVQSITSTTEMVCERALYGTDAGDSDSANWNQGHASGFPIFLPFFNAHYDVDKYSVAQTDNNGKFKCFNFFGLGRASSGVQGIVPGSVAMKFYNSGYQSLGLSGITPSTNSGLTASETLKLDITVDGDAFADLTFTLDSSNVNFGGTNGVISKIQAAFDEQYYTAGNLFEKRVIVGIVDGDIRFTSGQHLSTSAILLADTGDGADSFIDSTANGRIPASGDIPAPVAARLPDDVIYDPITYATSPNTGVFLYDDGLGNLFGMGRGTINYETGAIDVKNCPPNAEFVYSVAHSSAFSGKASSGKNALVRILANTPSQKWDGACTVTGYE